jgi:hypothetical protein
MDRITKIDPMRARWDHDLIPLNLTAFIMDLIEDPEYLRKIDWSQHPVDWSL